MSQPRKTDHRLQAAERSSQEAAASRETSRSSDSVPMVSGSFAHLPARFGRYQVERLLGRGAMGAVYLARDMKLNRRVALKIPKVSPAGSNRLLLRLETEAKAAAQLDHPSLCKVFDAGQVEGQCFIAMQYIEGETLKSRLEANDISVSEAVALVLQVAEGLLEAHELGIVHRDLKPENIMINQRGIPVIMDFGLAKFSNISGNATTTQAGTILGSPAYMSPEQASGRNQEIDQRSDIYALGVILFELLTGELPFSGSSMVVMGQKSILEPPSPSSVNRQLPSELSDVCHKMIAKENGDRYQSLKEVIADLRACNSLIPQSVEPDTKSSEPSSYALEEADVPAEIQDRLPRIGKKKRVGKASKNVSRPILFGGIAAGFVFLLGIVVWFQTGDALVKVEILSPDVEVKFLDKTIQLADGANEYRVTPGLHSLHIKSGNVEFETDKLSLKKGTNPAVSVELVNADVVATWGDLVIGKHRKGVTGSSAQPSVQSSRLSNSASPSPATASVVISGTPVRAVAPFDTAGGAGHQQAWAKYLGVPVEYTNSIGMKFVLIPPGEFQMGSTPVEVNAASDKIGVFGWLEQIRSEGPQHTVILTKPFYLGIHEVTQKSYQEVAAQNPSHYAATGAGKNEVAGINTADFPVEMVSWIDAAKFCEKLSEREKLKPFYTANGTAVSPFTGTGYRLPTEAEWEFACRAGTTTKFWTEGATQELQKVASIGNRPTPVGSKIKNSFGLYDLHGNVWEIVHDNWKLDAYAEFQKKAAVDPCVFIAGNRDFVVRGGCWSNVHSCRSAARSPSGPPFTHKIIGFRVALTVEAVKGAIQKSVSTSGPVLLRSSTSEPNQAGQGLTELLIPSQPQLKALNELNGSGFAASAWISADGLRIYWEHALAGTGDYEIRQAERRDPSLPFGNTRVVGQGKQPTLTPDELEMVFIQAPPGRGKRLFTAKRKALTDRFSQEQELTQFPADLTFNNPCFSADGLSLFVNARSEPDIKASRYYVSRRQKLSGSWSKLEPLPIQWNAVLQKAPLTWLAMAPDELSFLATHELDVGNFRIVRFTRATNREAFQNFEYLKLPGMDAVYGRTPRYLPATRELYLTAPNDYSRASSQQGWQGGAPHNLWVIRNVDLPGFTSPNTGGVVPPKSEVPVVSRKFTSVFNGKDLKGWKPMQYSGQNDHLQTETVGGWLVRKGEIVCTTDTPGWLRLDQPYGDCEIEFDFLLPPKVNSGLLVHYPIREDIAGLEKCEIQLINEIQPRPDHNCGAIHGVVAPSRNAFKPNVWNTMSIRLQSGRITVQLNKIQIVDVSTNDHPTLRALPATGYFGLYNWRGAAKGARFRDIRVKDLSSATP